jgi:hypothetical protein
MASKSILGSHTSLTPEARQILREGQRDQLISGLMALTAVALFVAPWITGRPDIAKDAHRNELAVGMFVLFLAMARFKWHLGRWSDVAVLAAGAWLVASPWLLGLGNTRVFTDDAPIFDVVAGGVLIVLALVSMALYSPTPDDGGRSSG